MSVTFDFTGRVVLVTGSSSGIGAATAIQFAKSGASVVVTGPQWDATNVTQVANQCRQLLVNSSAKVTEVLADVTKEGDLRRLVDTTIEANGKLDILVNCAAALFPLQVSDIDYCEKFRKTMDLCLNSVVMLTHICIPYLKQSNGSIVNISSVAGLRSGYKYSSAYSCAKAGLVMFTKCCAIELGPKVRVNSISVGPTKTRFMEAMGMSSDKVNAFYDRMTRELPVGRMGESDDIAMAVLFLSSDMSSFTTGSDWVIDGGSMAKSVM